MTSAASIGVVVGQRIQLEDGRHACVAFVGPLPGQPSQRVFLGLEYDHAEQGKHDGCYQGRRIFGPTRLLNAASFLALDSIEWLPSASCAAAPVSAPSLSSSASASSGSTLQAASPSCRVRAYTGIHLGDAIEYKYRPAAGAAVSVGGRTVEMVLSHKDTHGPKTILSLPSFHIVACECPRPLPIALETVEELDLTDNMIADWSTAAPHLARLLPRLRMLNLSENPVNSTGHSPLTMGLRTLVLNRCPSLLWRTVAAISCTLPHLIELHLSENRLSQPSQEEVPQLWAALTGLEQLSLDGNCFSDWDHIEWIHGLSRLERLVLNQCGLTRVGMQRSSSFPRLLHLSLSDNPIETWVSVRQLASIPSLRDLRLQRCPVVSSESDTSARLLIVGLLPDLTSLNGSRISQKEKEDAERLLLLRASDLHLTNLVSSAVLDSLRAKHADLVMNESRPALDPPDAVLVQLTSPFADQINRSVPLRLTVAKLVALFKRCFPSLESYPFELYVSAVGASPARIPLEMHSSTLHQVVPWLNASLPIELKIEARI